MMGPGVRMGVAAGAVAVGRGVAVAVTSGRVAVAVVLAGRVAVVVVARRVAVKLHHAPAGSETMHTAARPTAERSATDWFAEAKRCYIEEHQGCPWCGGPHRVTRVEIGARTTFTCQRCDFQVVYDAQTGRYTFIRGEELSDMTDTMLGYPIFQI